MGNRASSLWEKADIISGGFVPVVLNGSVDKRGDMVSRFFKQVSKHFANDMAVVTPNAELLSHSLDEGLRKWKELPEARRRALSDFGPYDPALDPQPPPGGLRFRVFARAFQRSSAGTVEPYKTKVTRSLEAGRDQLWVSSDETRALGGAGRPVGLSTALPETLIDRICRMYLIDLVRVGGNGNPRKPDEILSKELTLTVLNVSPREARMELRGSCRLATHDVGCGSRSGAPKIDDFTFRGQAVYDLGQGEFKRFDFIAYSPTGHYDEVNEKILPLGIAFELNTSEQPADRLPPAYYSPSYFAVPPRK
jgi:hypothetical protein